MLEADVHNVQLTRVIVGDLVAVVTIAKRGPERLLSKLNPPLPRLETISFREL